MEYAFEIEHAYLRRDGEYILEDVSLSIKKGEKIAIVGPNGAGKSSLMDVLSRVSYPLCRDDYKNRILGQERWIISELKPLIGRISPQDDAFFNTTYPVREIVASGLHSSLGFDFHHVVDEETWILADKALEKAGILHLKNRAMNTLSTGEKRRVILSRATITNPLILLLDEASNGLDFPSRADLRETIRTYLTDNRTVVMVTHELSEIIPEVDRILLMKNGRIVYDGDKVNALTSKRLSQLYERDVVVSEKEGIYTAFC